MAAPAIIAVWKSGRNANTFQPVQSEYRTSPYGAVAAAGGRSRRMTTPVAAANAKGGEDTGLFRLR